MFALKRHLLAAILVAGFAAQAASAHAFLDHAQPRVGSHVKVSPHHVIIWFTEAVEPLFSRIQVFNSAGKEVDNKNTHRLHGKKAVLVVTVPTLPPGRYKVVWHVVAEDTHKTHGDFKFWVK